LATTYYERYPVKMGGECPECHQRPLIYDGEHNELVCTSCGLVIEFEQRLVDEESVERGLIGTPAPIRRKANQRNKIIERAIFKIKRRSSHR